MNGLSIDILVVAFTLTSILLACAYRMVLVVLRCPNETSDFTHLITDVRRRGCGQDAFDERLSYDAALPVECPVRSLHKN
jgi:hypothetical protein